MPIQFDERRKTFTLATERTLYQMGLGPAGHLTHLYYGPRTEGCFDYLQMPRDCGFSPNPYELQEGRGWSLDTQAQEYSASGSGDFRVSCLEAESAGGIRGADLRYLSHGIRTEKYTLTGLPTAFDKSGEAQTLSILLGDAATGLQVELLYGVFPRQDVITRAARIHNRGAAAIRLNKAASVCLDLPFGQWELLHFHGRHAMERMPERAPLINGIQTVSSARGASSHQHNPFVILCAPETGDRSGPCYGMMLLYSGNHRTDVEVDQAGSTRAVMGISDRNFAWTLEPGEAFDAPEALLTFTAEGLDHLSHTYHRFLRENVCRSPFAREDRPVLLNSWEAAYMDFDGEKLLRIARDAKELGVELFVIDDGWFGNRTDDRRGLGDWFPNETRLPGGLRPLLEGIHALGLKAGLWLEPEMVSEDSRLYRQHPDWALTAPGRKPAMGRSQLVLDMGRGDVVNWLYETISALLRENPIDYIKWDMNRHLTDLYSHALPAARQGEVSHRYVLGLYSLLDRLTSEFPEVLFEGCSGGGGRFDGGMLCYHPQIWCSDNTDPIARLAIQEGTSYGYPIGAVGAHVSASPNHQTGRATPLGTRAVAAMSGTFGYELDPALLTPAEKAEVRRQIARFQGWQGLIREGDYYRLKAGQGTAWAFVSPERDRLLLNFVLAEVSANPRPLHLYLKGLDANARYKIQSAEFYGCKAALPHDPERVFTGGELMYGGYTLPMLLGDYPSAQIYWEKTEETGETL